MRQNGALIRKFAQDELYDGMLVGGTHTSIDYEERFVLKKIAYNFRYVCFTI